MSRFLELDIADWGAACSAQTHSLATSALEAGCVLLLPHLAFALAAGEEALMSPAVAGRAKNVSFDLATGRVRGTEAPPAERAALEAMMRRFAEHARTLLLNLAPGYARGLEMGRTSFRPAEVAGRATSWRKDDTRLHVDSFPASPVRDRRILRLFSNVNPRGEPRSWRLGEPFEAVAQRFLPRVRPPLPWSSALLRLLHVTKSRRSAYDHFMLGIHDGMKADTAYQESVKQLAFDFPAGSTWIVFTDHVSHAAMKGRCALEQTFYVPVAAMREPERAPLRVLERLSGRALA